MTTEHDSFDKKAAKLFLKLTAESGYSSTCKYQISPNQWGDVLRVCEGTLASKVEKERDLFRTALVRMIGADTHRELVIMRELIDITASEGDNKAAALGAIDALLTTLPDEG